MRVRPGVNAPRASSAAQQLYRPALIVSKLQQRRTDRNGSQMEVFYQNEFRIDRPRLRGAWRDLYDGELQQKVENIRVPLLRLAHVTHNAETEEITTANDYQFTVAQKCGRAGYDIVGSYNGDTGVRIYENTNIFPGYYSWWSPYAHNYILPEGHPNVEDCSPPARIKEILLSKSMSESTSDEISSKSESTSDEISSKSESTSDEISSKSESTSDQIPLTESISEQDSIDEMVPRQEEPIQNYYVANYLKDLSESIYGNCVFHCSFKDLLNAYAFSRRDSHRLYIKRGGTLRYRGEICFVLIVCTESDQLHFPRLHRRGNFETNGLINKDGRVINRGAIANFHPRHIIQWARDDEGDRKKIYSYITAAFAFYYPNKDGKLVVDRKKCRATEIDKHTDERCLKKKNGICPNNL